MSEVWLMKRVVSSIIYLCVLQYFDKACRIATIWLGRSQPQIVEVRLAP